MTSNQHYMRLGLVRQLVKSKESLVNSELHASGITELNQLQTTRMDNFSKYWIHFTADLPLNSWEVSNKGNLSPLLTLWLCLSFLIEIKLFQFFPSTNIERRNVCLLRATFELILIIESMGLLSCYRQIFDSFLCLITSWSAINDTAKKLFKDTSLPFNSFFLHYNYNESSLRLLVRVSSWLAFVRLIERFDSLIAIFYPCSFKQFVI